ncbi:hypothetical protein H2198_010643 [Neophaeococcomyces mojaviensis]|uniref:Uncharacterized protein n=1 Tax=Neophaeococcomyces mojaviensis TaxID=3383035 RepID=A0ACC2ZR45_9EURO|nr:hypothetical protein H2198_010643 [Knufia sp. JES_112]
MSMMVRDEARAKIAFRASTPNDHVLGLCCHLKAAKHASVFSMYDSLEFVRGQSLPTGPPNEIF